MDGYGGCGKSYVIQVVCYSLRNMAEAVGHKDPVLRCAPTGVAASLIHGRTLHSVLRLDSKAKEYEPATDAKLAGLQRDLDGVKYVFCDEKSMVGLKMMGMISQRLQEAFPDKAGQPCGGLSVILLGDFHQLPPVFDKPLYYTKRGLSALEQAGQAAYLSIDRTVRLDVAMHQQGDDHAPFRSVLQAVRSMECTQAHWEILARRCRSHEAMTPEEVVKFDNALRIFPKNQQVDDHNYRHMDQLGRPVVGLRATGSGVHWDKARSSDAFGLDMYVPVCLGARVMCSQNLCTQWGLVNGAIGTVEDIVWKEGADCKADRPHLIMVHFNNYTGPAVYQTDDGRTLVPVFVTTRRFNYKGLEVERTQFPLFMAFAITVHKSQGATLARAVIKIADKEFTPGLTYVALSRVKTLDGILFDAPFGLEVLRGGQGRTGMSRLADWTRRNN